MAIWKMTSKEEYNYKPEVAISFAPYSGSNVLAGTITFRGIECRIFGQWGPAGSLPERKYSAFAIWASNQAEAMFYVAATGTIERSDDDPDGMPKSMLINMYTASTADGNVFAWSGTLLPGSKPPAA